MKLTRREFAKLSSLLLAILLTGCPSLDQTLGTAISILNAASGIITPLNAVDGKALSVAAKTLGDVNVAYQDYEKAEASLKPGKAVVVEAAIAATQDNLSVILADVRVKNPALIATITTAVAIANTVLEAILNKLPADVKASAARANRPRLPTIKAKSADDLKKYWNQTVAAEYPRAVVQ